MNLNPRETFLVVLALLVVLCGYGYQFHLQPRLEELEDIRPQIANLQESLARMRALREEHAALKAELRPLRRRTAAADDRRLYDLLKDLVAAQGLAGQADFDNNPGSAENGYRKQVVQVSLRSVSQPRVGTLLEAAENAELPIVIERCTITGG